MSRALRTLRDHAQKLADGEEVRLPRGVIEANVSRLASQFTDQTHRATGPRTYLHVEHDVQVRALWRQIANEITAFLDEPAQQHHHDHDEQPGLFATTEETHP